MKISGFKEDTYFNLLKVGEMCLYDGALFLKILPINVVYEHDKGSPVHTVHALKLSDQSVQVMGDRLVTPVHGEFVIKDLPNQPVEDHQTVESADEKVVYLYTSHAK